MSKLIGEGGYGCVYFPNFNCEGKVSESKKFVSKIQLNDEDIIKEIQIGKKITKIPFYNLYFAPIIKSCNINMALFENKSLIQDCNIIDKNPNKNFINSTIPYIKGQEFKDYVSSIRDNDLYVIILFNSYYYLLNSLQILYSQNIIQYDIKFENIIYDSQKKIPIIIDFGLSFPFLNIENYSSIKSLKKIFYIYAPHYYIWCPEIQIISYIVEHNSSKKESVLTEYVLKVIIKEIVDSMKIWYLFSDEFKQLYYKKLYNFYSQFVNKSDNYVIRELLKYNSTWDTYSLSISFLKEFIYKIQKSIDFKNDNLKNNEISLIIILIQLLLYSLSPNPSLRPTIAKLKEILYTTFDNNFTGENNGIYLNFSLNENEYKFIKEKIIPNLHFFIN